MSHEITGSFHSCVTDFSSSNVCHRKLHAIAVDGICYFMHGFLFLFVLLPKRMNGKSNWHSVNILSSLAGHTCYKATEEITPCVENVCLSRCYDLWRLYLLGMPKANRESKHA